jgi:hypothetical protein
MNLSPYWKTAVNEFTEMDVYVIIVNGDIPEPEKELEKRFC